MEEHKGMKEGHWEMQTHPGLITLSLAEILSLTDFLVKQIMSKTVLHHHTLHFIKIFGVGKVS